MIQYSRDFQILDFVTINDPLERSIVEETTTNSGEIYVLIGHFRVGSIALFDDSMSFLLATFRQIHLGLDEISDSNKGIHIRLEKLFCFYQIKLHKSRNMSPLGY